MPAVCDHCSKVNLHIRTRPFRCCWCNLTNQPTKPPAPAPAPVDTK